VGIDIVTRLAPAADEFQVGAPAWPAQAGIGSLEHVLTVLVLSERVPSSGADASF
jgi:hypothetical protein